MKIINEKGKLFGLINIVDLLVLIAAVAVAAGVGYKLFAPQIKESVQPQVELTAIVRVRGATPFLVTEVERNSQVGKQLVSGNSYVNGTIEDMKIEDYAQQVTTADGRIVTAVEPLLPEEKKRGLMQVYEETERQWKNGNLVRVYADIQGERLTFERSAQ